MALNKYDLINKKQLERYAELAVKVSVNVQPGQLMIISCPVEDYFFARLVQKHAYTVGAGNVIIDWEDDFSTKAFYLNAVEEYIGDFPCWEVEKYKVWDESDACYLHIRTEHPNLFSDVSPEKITRHTKIKRKKLTDHRAKKSAYQTRWGIIMVPSEQWAKKMFPNLEIEEALICSWNSILYAGRVTGDNPVQDWTKHGETFKSVIKFLDDIQFKTLHFRNSLGTDLTVGLVKNHRFIGGSCRDAKGIDFFPNIPTEEVFTNPHKYKVNGKLVASKPFIYAGNIIEDVVLEFENGKIINHSASKGYNTLTAFLNTDEGTRYLGEIALAVPDSPLGQINHLFYSTMFDENTGCHIGIGSSNPSCMKNAYELKEMDFDKIGLNKSCLLVNMTIGTKDMTVMGISSVGKQVKIIENGNYVIGNVAKPHEV